MQVSYRTMIYCSMQYYMKTLRMSLKLQLQKYSDPDNVYCTKINHDRSNNQILTFTCVRTTYSMALAIEELKSCNLKFVTLTVAHVLSPRSICGQHNHINVFIELYRALLFIIKYRMYED